jgi:hypothetical protein
MTSKRLILQAESSAEVRACLMAASLASPPIPVLRSSLANIKDMGRLIAAGVGVPVGSVEFMRAAMAAAGISEPEPLSYPVELLRHCGREIKLRRAGEVIGTWFVKPVKTKLFTGFVFDTMTDPATLSEHDREQYDAFIALDPAEPVWISEVVKFQSEWRFYVEGRRVLGKARYDTDGADDAPAPDEETVARILADLPFVCPCAVDIGVLADGSTVLVEVNDAWAIGFYQDAMPAKDYMNFLVTRWEQIHRDRLTVIR